MALFTLSAPKIRTGEEGMKFFGPVYFGTDTEYIPFY